MRGVWLAGWAAMLLRATAAATAADLAPLLDPMFQDHAVLQRERPIPLWGLAKPGDTLTIQFHGSTLQARADMQGHWQQSLPAAAPGGPYVLTVRAQSGASQSVSDVLVGDVWLCSGQSNMELPVARSLNAEGEIAAAGNNLIRLLTIAHADRPARLPQLAGAVRWQLAAPASVRDFSAACYYFARELQRTVKVPMGLIHSAWGGSNIEGWISDPGLRPAGDFATQLDLLRDYARDPLPATREFGRRWENWWAAGAPSNPAPWQNAAAQSGEWRAAPEPMRNWKTWGVPELANHDGMVWFRRTFTLNNVQASQTATLSLGGIDEVDETWVNGQVIGDSFGWGTERSYQVPAGVLRAGENSVVVNVLSTWDAAGMYGPPEHMALRFPAASTVALGGDWRYQFVPNSLGYPPRAPWHPIGGLTCLYNGMIAPLGHYGLRGALWYQGESNTGDAEHYQQLLGALMADWRVQFGSGLPFLIVQLPNFGAPPGAPVASGWASLREAQRRAVASDAHAALAVTIDIGERRELHPPDKQELGNRLARAARHLVYGEALSPSGPAPSAAHRDNGAITVNFKDVDGALVAYSASTPIGFELCGATQQSCEFVSGSIEPTRVRLEPGSLKSPTRVRYCWGDGPVCNLYDHSGLPAGPFELAID